eukprot:808910-Amorphochlora_amoeboformis.AAC.1
MGESDVHAHPHTFVHGLYAINLDLISAQKSLSDEEKKEYVELAQADKKRYKAEMEEYRKNGGTNTSGSGMGETDDPIATLFPLAKVKKVIQLDIKDRRVAKDGRWLKSESRKFLFPSFI